MVVRYLCMFSTWERGFTYTIAFWTDLTKHHLNAPERRGLTSPKEQPTTSECSRWKLNMWRQRGPNKTRKHKHGRGSISKTISGGIPRWVFFVRLRWFEFIICSTLQSQRMMTARTGKCASDGFGRRKRGKCGGYPVETSNGSNK